MCDTKEKIEYEHHCLRCGTTWKSEKEIPDCCKGCHSYDYDKLPVGKLGRKDKWS
jgi:predicted  nucleic acid-binding Zn-ribbon protein